MRSAAAQSRSAESPHEQRAHFQPGRLGRSGAATCFSGAGAGAAARAVLRGAPRRNRHHRDTGLGGQVPDRVHHQAADLPRQAGVALAVPARLQGGQVFQVDDAAAGRDRLIHRPAGRRPRQRVIEAADPRADALVLRPRPGRAGRAGRPTAGAGRPTRTAARRSGRVWRPGVRGGRAAGAVSPRSRSRRSAASAHRRPPAHPQGQHPTRCPARRSAAARLAGWVGQAGDGAGQQRVHPPIQPQPHPMPHRRSGRDRDGERQIDPQPMRGHPQRGRTPVGVGGYVRRHREHDHMPRPIGPRDRRRAQRQPHPQHRRLRPTVPAARGCPGPPEVVASAGVARVRVSSCLSAAASSTCAATTGAPSTPVTSAGNASVLGQVRADLPGAVTDLRRTRPGGQRRAQRPPLRLRAPGTGRPARSRAPPPAPPADAPPARSARAASSSAMRRTRSGTYTPTGAAHPQPNRRSAIHPLAGNARPSPLLPEASSVSAAPVHRSATTCAAMVWASAASQPTRRTSTRSPTTSPLGLQRRPVGGTRRRRRQHRHPRPPPTPVTTSPDSPTRHKRYRPPPTLSGPSPRSPPRGETPRNTRHQTHHNPQVRRGSHSVLGQQYEPFLVLYNDQNRHFFC